MTSQVLVSNYQKCALIWSAFHGGVASWHGLARCDVALETLAGVEVAPSQSSTLGLAIGDGWFLAGMKS